ncbi:hypothetical protein EJ05DRAFT_511407 [Pseudovirgaria hyperparasitica]|uniref:Uncharacterized protein n=1 Tax=Pseudovirgaria hyperparasitica TaxID=470096 RepID=A0A6A6W4V6_9PEZI|nr:uncharacterized protein EJ05DRAFT_511407 [Pseudovirgaria hyperparasitica]KAF2757623.1 hypothetical protein EJ05DRAFT_511407 [Pseudovirgaria hyperparasitica]
MLCALKPCALYTSHNAALFTRRYIHVSTTLLDAVHNGSQLPIRFIARSPPKTNINEPTSGCGPVIRHVKRQKRVLIRRIAPANPALQSAMPPTVPFSTKSTEPNGRYRPVIRRVKKKVTVPIRRIASAIPALQSAMPPTIPSSTKSTEPNGGHGRHIKKKKEKGISIRRIPLEVPLVQKSTLPFSGIHKYPASGETRYVKVDDSVSLSHPVEHCGTYGMVTTQNATATTLKDLLRQVPAIPSNSFVGSPTILLLLTPCYAQALNQGLVEELQILRERLFRNHSMLNSTDVVKTLVAVVDRLAEPRDYEMGPPSRAPPILEDGLDGISYAVMDSRHISSSTSLSQLDRFDTDVPEDLATTPTLSFHMNESLRRRSPRKNIQVHVPLANTLFQNGYEYTMSLYTIKKPESSAPVEVVSIKHELKRASILWPFDISGRGRNSSTSLACPLLPLTGSLKILDVMGNIISRLENKHNSVIPASLHVEQGVHKFFDVTRTDPCSVSIWALLYPYPADFALRVVSTYNRYLNGRSRRAITQIALTQEESFVDFWRHTAWNDHIMRALNRGASLHRVMSGGGGWGNKAGLLSLDPYKIQRLPMDEKPLGMLDSDRDCQDSKQSKFSFEDLAGEDENASATFRPGDYLQFFIMPPISQQEVARRALTGDSTPSSQAVPTTKWSLDFGTVPSTVDEVPQYSESKDVALTQVTVHPDRFSALSEKAIHVQSSEERVMQPTVTYSKLDVPYTRWNAADDFLHVRLQPIGYLKRKNRLRIRRIPAHKPQNLFLHYRIGKNRTHSLRRRRLPRHPVLSRNRRIRQLFRKYLTTTKPKVNRHTVSFSRPRRVLMNQHQYVRRGGAKSGITDPSFDELENITALEAAKEQEKEDLRRIRLLKKAKFKPSVIRRTLTDSAKRAGLSPEHDDLIRQANFETFEPGMRHRRRRMLHGDDWATEENARVYSSEKRRRERLAELLRERMAGNRPAEQQMKRYSDEDAAAVVDQIDMLLRGL